MSDWSVRIPAAIEKGRELLIDEDESEREWCVLDGIYVSQGEVALASVVARFWKDECEDCQAHSEPRFGCHAPPPELIAFTEKIESVSSPGHRRS